MTGKKIKQLRIGLGMTQQGFASLLGTSIVSVNRWEKGHSHASGLAEIYLNLIAKLIPHHSASKIVETLHPTRGESAALLRALFALEKECFAP